MRKNYLKWGVISVAIMLAVLGMMTKFSDPQEVTETLGKLGPVNLVIIIVLSLTSVLLRNLRWKTLLKGAGFSVGYLELFPVYVAGQAASLVTPGKSGDLLRAYGLKTKKGFAIKRTIATIFVERFVDFSMMLLFTIYGFTAFGPQSVLPIAAVASVMVLTAGALVSRRVARAIVAPIRPVVYAIGRLRGIKDKARESYYAVRALGATPQFYASIVIGIVVWAIEFSRIHFTVLVLGGHATQAQIAFAACLGILLGMATMLPGGAGGYEATFMGVMSVFGVSVPVIAGVLIIERVVGYGSTLLIGMISMKWVKV